MATARKLREDTDTTTRKQQRHPENMRNPRLLAFLSLLVCALTKVRSAAKINETYRLKLFVYSSQSTELALGSIILDELNSELKRTSVYMSK